MFGSKADLSPSVRVLFIYGYQLGLTVRYPKTSVGRTSPVQSRINHMSTVLSMKNTENALNI